MALRSVAAVVSTSFSTSFVVLLLSWGSGGCGSGSSSSSSTTPNAVDIVATCPAVVACGGDPTGTWDIVHGCAEQDSSTCATGGSGTVKGHFTIQSGSYNLDLDTSITACGQTDSSGDGSGGTATVSGNSITFAGGDKMTFCVQGDTLYLLRDGAKSPKLRLITLKKSAGDGGTDGG